MYILGKAKGKPNNQASEREKQSKPKQKPKLKTPQTPQTPKTEKQKTKTKNLKQKPKQKSKHPKSKQISNNYTYLKFLSRPICYGAIFPRAAVVAMYAPEQCSVTRDGSNRD
jgi:hypothetical protein